MFGAEQLPEYDITDDVTSGMQSGIQSKPAQERPSFNEEVLGEHIAELFDGDDVMEIVTETLNTAIDNGEPTAIITCEHEGNDDCKELERILTSHSKIESFESGTFSGRFGFIIQLKNTLKITPQKQEEAEDEDLAA